MIEYYLTTVTLGLDSFARVTTVVAVEVAVAITAVVTVVRGCGCGPVGVQVAGAGKAVFLFVSIEGGSWVAMIGSFFFILGGS